MGPGPTYTVISPESTPRRKIPMHLYWRVIEELKFINETWTMTDPSLSRCYERWMRKNAAALFLAEFPFSPS